MQLCLADLPFIPKALQNTKVLTVFISSDFLDDLEGNFCIREYSTLEDLVEKDFGNSIEGVKLFPLFPRLIENDFPAWEDGDDISNDVADIILRKEEKALNTAKTFMKRRRQCIRLGVMQIIAEATMHYLKPVANLPSK